MPSCARPLRVARLRFPLRFALLVSSLALLALAGLTSSATGQVLVKREAPVSLTGSDGAGLELVSYQATAVVQEPLAFTELHLVFRNPEARVREGRFRIALPAGAAVSRFAMKLDTFWQEGEVVERQAARVAYEDALHRRQDPALLENDAGNEFAARVFPIPPGATKELILSYSEELGTSGVPYRLALQGLPRMASLDVRVLVGTAEIGHARSNLGGTSIKQEVVELQKTAFKPDRDFELPRAASGPLGLRDGNAVVARVSPFGQRDNGGNSGGKTAGVAPLSSLQVLVDTSASRALGFDDELARLRSVLAALAKGGDFPVTVTAFDQEVVKVWSGSASAYPANIDEKLRARQALGASHLEGALASLTGKGRVLLVTDGIATAGATQGDELRLAVQKLGARGVERLDVLPVGGLRDDELLRGLVAAGLPHAGRVLSSDESPEQLAQRMRLETSGDLAVSVEGATWFWPTHVQGLQPGDDVVVYAELPANKPLRVLIGGHAPAALPAVFASAERPLLLRALTQARLSRLSEQRDTLAAGDRDLREALRRQMVELSVKNRVLCRETALVVLESDNDYARFGINRQALAEILTVGLKGIEVLRRTQPVAEPKKDMLLGAVKKSKAPLRPLSALADDSATDRGAASGAAPAMEPATNQIAGGAPPSAPEPALQGALDDRLAEKSTSAAPAAAQAPPPPAPMRVAAQGSLRDRASAAPMANAARANDMREESKVAESEAGPAERSLASAARPPRHVTMARAPALANANDNEVKGAPAWEGPFAEVMTLVKRGSTGAALERAWAWRRSAPGDVLALVALGEALEHAKQPGQAARAYGSIIDLFPGRADLRRFAGGHLERLQGKLGSAAIELAIDSFRKAAADRPDHPSSHRLLAFALLKGGHDEEAFDALINGLHQRYPDNRFLGAMRILQEDLGLIAAVWSAHAPGDKTRILGRLRDAGVAEENEPSVRFVLTWETDANDVDFHIKDGRGGHAFYSQPTLPSGGELYADVTTGYGPECFTVRHPETARAYPYVLQAHYYSRGPMGYGMGKLQILNHDGRGHIRFDDRPFVVMVDNAFVDLGRLDK